jgi:hypothetical protein
MEIKIATTVKEIVDVYTDYMGPYSCMKGWGGYNLNEHEWHTIGHPVSFYGLCENTAVAYAIDGQGVHARAVVIRTRNGWRYTTVYSERGNYYRFSSALQDAGIKRLFYNDYPGLYYSEVIIKGVPFVPRPNKGKGDATYLGCPCPSFDNNRVAPRYLNYRDGVFTFSYAPNEFLYHKAPSTSDGFYFVDPNNPIKIRNYDSDV